MSTHSPASDASSPAQREWRSTSVRQTQRIGEYLGKLCQPGDLILLQGDLGAGKTALAQGLGAGLGVAGVINSPTFTLVKEYAGRIPLYHFDLYRLDAAAQVEDLGIEDYLERDGVCVVEWPERALEVWPARWLRLRLRVTGAHTRRIACDSEGPRGLQLCELLGAACQQTDDKRAATARREATA